MDTTRITDLLSQLEAADPADAPDVADELTAVLAETLDGSQPTADQKAGSETSEAETADP